MAKENENKTTDEIENAIKILAKYCRPNSKFCEKTCPIKELCYSTFNEAPSEWMHKEK